jgi:hypothetical protein
MQKPPGGVQIAITGLQQTVPSLQLPLPQGIPESGTQAQIPGVLSKW